MNKRIFSIALIMLITLSIFVPISVSAEDTMVLKAGTYTFNSKINNALQSFTTQEQFENALDELILYRIDTYEVSCFRVDGIFTIDGEMTDMSNCICVILGNGNYDPANLNSWQYDFGMVNGESNGIGWSKWNSSLDTPTITINDYEVSTELYNWFVASTDYNTVNGLPSQGTPDYGTPDVTYTIPAGLYIFNETPILPTEDITQDFPTYFSVMINNGLENVIYNGLRMKFTTTTIEYNLDGTLTTVYKAPPLADGGWSNVAYRQVTFLEDVTVSEDFYNLFILNTTPPPENKPPYVFTIDGITYDGNTYATYKDENTKRVDVENTYCAMFDNGYVYIVSSTEPFRIASSGHVRPNPSINFDMWYIENGVINYMGTNTSFNPEKWVAGNHSILNWDNDAQYHGFDIGMVFPTTPAATPTLVEIVKLIPMSGVMKEMIVILPCLIALLTAFLGLRKALAILQEILHQA